MKKKLNHSIQSQHNWEAQYYDQTANYVTKFGEGVLDLLAAQPGERIIDLGCGTGHLTEKIKQTGATVIGVDLSPTMIEQAKQTYPTIDFRVENAEDFHFDPPVDAVFSNAALHWMKNPEAVIQSIARSLRRGGRFVAEFGGENNVVIITEAIYIALEEQGVSRESVFYPWYFPSVAEYTALLEANGFTVHYVQYFDRWTWLENCPHGVQDWVRNFGTDFLQALPEGKHQQLLSRVSELTKPHLYKDDKWYADYKRLRFLAVKK